MMLRLRSHGILAAAVVLAGCEQPLGARPAVAPSIEAQIASAAEVAGDVDPADLARAKSGLNRLMTAWSSPGAAALHAQGRRAQSDAMAIARSLCLRSGDPGRELHEDVAAVAAEAVEGRSARARCP